MDQLVAAQMVQAAKVVEEKLDEEMDRLNNLNDEELDKIKKERVMQMRKQQEKRQEWIKNGHGQYEEIPEEKEFFEVTKKSENVICHFYTDSTFRCKIVDKHMGKAIKLFVRKGSYGSGPNPLQRSWLPSTWRPNSSRSTLRSAPS